MRSSDADGREMGRRRSDSGVGRGFGLREARGTCAKLGVVRMGTAIEEYVASETDR